jgi:periplasmic protein CpxP/Spy
MMKKTISTAVALTLGATLAFAGPGEGKRGFHGKEGKRGEAHMARLAEKLNLTDAQKAQLEEQRKNFRATNQARFETYRDTNRQYRQALEAKDQARVEALKATLQIQKGELQQLRKAQHEAMLSVLTAEQKAELEAMKSERGERHGKRHRQR